MVRWQHFFGIVLHKLMQTTYGTKLFIARYTLPVLKVSPCSTCAWSFEP